MSRNIKLPNWNAHKPKEPQPKEPHKEEHHHHTKHVHHTHYNDCCGRHGHHHYDCCHHPRHSPCHSQPTRSLTPEEQAAADKVSAIAFGIVCIAVVGIIVVSIVFHKEVLDVDDPIGTL